jgi:4a-hydroxytetrahydrobiopterin dehydratase
LARRSHRGNMNAMARPPKLEQPAIDAWIATHPGWECVSGNSLTREYKFPDFATALGFTVRVGLAAERRDHHPDVQLGWGRARVIWSTHDARGVTSLDIELAEATDKIYG